MKPESRAGRRAGRFKQIMERRNGRKPLFSFREIADQYALVGGKGPDEGNRQFAYKSLLEAALAGEFERDGRSQVLFLHSSSNLARLSRKDLAKVHAWLGPGCAMNKAYLHRCWISRDLLQWWLRKKNTKFPPEFFRGKSSKRRGRPPKKANPAPDDAVLYREMDHLIKTGKAGSVNRAAKLVALKNPKKPMKLGIDLQRETDRLRKGYARHKG